MKGLSTIRPWLTQSSQVSYGHLDVVCVIALMSRLRRVSFVADLQCQHYRSDVACEYFFLFLMRLKVFCIAYLETLY